MWRRQRPELPVELTGWGRRAAVSALDHEVVEPDDPALAWSRRVIAEAGAHGAGLAAQVRALRLAAPGLRLLPASQLVRALHGRQL